MVRRYFIFLLLLLRTMLLFSQETQTANTRTESMPSNPSTFNSSSLRLLQRAKQEFAVGNYEQVYSVSVLALTYDETIADFYYLQALSFIEQGKDAFEVIPLLETCLQLQWYEYSSDDARLLLSEYYARVNQPSLALALLDVPTPLLSAEANLIRAQANYIIGNVDVARSLILEGVSQYPNNTEYDDIFFKYEYRYVRQGLLDFVSASKSSGVHINDSLLDDEVIELNADSDTSSTFGISDEATVLFELEEVQPFVLQTTTQEQKVLADIFINRALSYINTSNTGLLYAAIFSDSVEQKVRLLRAWNATGEKNPLYAIYALESGLITEQIAFDYIRDFFDSISYETLIDFVYIVNTDDVRVQLLEYFRGFDGTLFFDTNGDLYSEMSVKYERGRPSMIEYDENQDGKIMWSSSVDFGVPQSVEMVEEETLITYSAWPLIQSVDNYNSQTKYFIVHNKLSWTPFYVVADEVFLHNLNYSFYIPQISNSLTALDDLALFNASYAIEKHTSEYLDSMAYYTLLDGVVKHIEYKQDVIPYAYAEFNNGQLVSRHVDNDRDGYFESIEIFMQTEELSNPDENRLNSIFGFEHVAKGYYIDKVLIDLNKDGIDDFSHEFMIVGGDIVTWDNNGDGVWEVRFIQDAQKIEQTIQYVHPQTKETVSIQLRDGIPVFSNGKAVVKDRIHDFYWIGDDVGSDWAELVIRELSSLNTSDIALIATDLIWNNSQQQYMRIIGIRNGDKYFGEVFYE